MSDADHRTRRQERRTVSDAITDRIRDSIPEDFWRVATWRDDGNWFPGSLDIADRQRIIRHVTAAALLLMADEMDEKQMGAKVDRHNAKAAHATTDEFFNYGKQRAWGEARTLLRSRAVRASGPADPEGATE